VSWVAVIAVLLVLLTPLRYDEAAYVVEHVQVGVATTFWSRGDPGNPDPSNACWLRAPRVSPRLRDDQLVFAHRTLPCGSYALVVNLRTGLSVVARKVDWGPRHALVDLSKRLARTVGSNGMEPVLVVPMPPGRSSW